MDDFAQFDAFERCWEFARVIAGHLRNGVFSKDPVLTTALRKTLSTSVRPPQLALVD
jgi:hypothetical protein